MADIKKVRFPVPGGIVRGMDGKEYKCTHIECSVGYELGGRSCWTGQNNARGYYAYVKPVSVSSRDGYTSVSFELFAGGKWLLVPCARRSSKREAEAVAKFDAEVRDYVAHLYDVAGIELAAA